jgi:7-cyano-7-deazaguanine synthase
MLTMETKIFCLLSGGLDSTVALAKMQSEINGDALAISIDYGQRHLREVDAALDVAHFLSVEHRVVSINGIIPTTMLTDASQPLPNAAMLTCRPASPRHMFHSATV